MYNLTDSQKDTIRWIVRKVREGNLAEEFTFVHLASGGIRFMGFGVKGDVSDHPPLTTGVLNALEESELILVHTSDRHFVTCTLLGKAYDAVDTDFSEKAAASITAVQRSSGSKKIGVALLFLGIAIAVATNLATAVLPDWLRPYLWLSWPLLIVLAAVSGYLWFRQ